MDAIETQEVGRYKVEVHYDDSHQDVRNYDNVGSVAGCTDWQFSEGDASYQTLRRGNGPIVALPIKVIDGSYTIVQTTSDWNYADGFYWAPLSKIEEEGWTDVSALKQCLRSELSTLNDELSGNVYGYVVLGPDDDVLESCWGFIGDADDAMQEGVEVAKWHDYKAACDWADLPEWVRQSVLIAVDA